jgi:hypothetical protein
LVYKDESMRYRFILFLVVFLLVVSLSFAECYTEASGGECPDVCGQKSECGHKKCNDVLNGDCKTNKDAAKAAKTKFKNNPSPVSDKRKSK